jgi:hypothetical protein
MKRLGIVFGLCGVLLCLPDSVSAHCCRGCGVARATGRPRVVAKAARGVGRVVAAPLRWLFRRPGCSE